MPPRKATTGEPKQSKTVARIQVLVSPKQRDIIAEIAKRAGSNSSTYVLAQTFRAIGQQKVGDEIPMIISGPTADRIRALADKQGISPDQMVEQLALGAGGAT